MSVTSGTNGAYRRRRDLDLLLDQLTVALPGDSLELPGEERRRILTAYHANETIEGVVTTWRWLLLDDGSLFEAAPKGCFRYSAHQEVPRLSPLYEEIVAQDGTLVRFERRVQAGTVGRRHVRVTLRDRSYRVAYTGTFSARRFGAQPALSAWTEISEDPSENVYFGLVSDASQDEVALGIWTGGVCLSYGVPLAPASVRLERE